MLDRRGHAGQAHAAKICQAQRRYDSRIGMECPLADRAVAALEVEHRRKAQVDVERAHLRGHQPGMLLCQRDRLRLVAIVQLAEARQRRQVCEPFAKALHGTAFLIDGEQERPFAHGTDL
jgi:hypothetical protein